VAEESLAFLVCGVLLEGSSTAACKDLALSALAFYDPALSV
jgi:hypothetical protein